MKRTYLILCTTLFVQSLIFAQSLSAQTLIKDDFSIPTSNWESVSLGGAGSFEVSNGALNVSAESGATFGVYNTQVLSGHFVAEVDFGKDEHVGLALFKARKDGTADPNNYSLIKVETIEGTPVVSISDKQNGKADVLDFTGKADKDLRYKNVLNASRHSVPYTSTNKKLRIFRHENERFIHFYYYVKKNVDGESASGWMELAPSKEWPELEGKFLMGLVALDGDATFDNAYATTKPSKDVDDTDKGFAASQRELNWGGYFGDALVVTFDRNDAPLTGGSRKFVFWEAFNNVPAWHLDDSLLYTYEFVETWGGGSKGCFEPMSDRLGRFSKVTLDYDGDDYKVIHWRYVLIDPDYNWPDHNLGSEKPTVDEHYKIYPDGTILRKIRYKPKLDTSFRNWHELTELIVVSGNVTDPVDHIDSPALTVWPLNGKRREFDPAGRGEDYEQSNKDATILAVHMKHHPDLISVLSDDPKYANTYPGDPITIYKTWHDKSYNMSHWPINAEQYHTDHFKSSTTWKEQIKHTSLAGAGAYENRSDQWESNFQVDPVDGRKYREWISYMSLSPKGKLEQTKHNVRSWLESPWDWKGESPQQ